MSRLASVAVASGLALVSVTAAKSAAEATANVYVGVGKCKECHAAEYSAWSETKHAQALANLAATSPDLLKRLNAFFKTAVDAPATDGKCLRCHVTGYNTPGGYTGSEPARDAQLAFVGCEVCHGAGSKHSTLTTSDIEGRRVTIEKPTEETCRTCHMGSHFDFAEMSSKVHPIAPAASGR